MGLVEWQERIDERLHTGGSLSDVETEIIDRSPFSREQKAALWWRRFPYKRLASPLPVRRRFGSAA